LSRRHCIFEREGGQWTVSDLKSKNGTLVNGAKIAGKYCLRPGDRVRASHVEIAFDVPPVTGQTVVFEAGRPAETTSAGGMLTSLKELQSEPTPASLRWNTPMQALIRAGRELVVSRPLAELFPVILTLSMEAVGAERGVLLTLEGGSLIPQASSGGEFRISAAVRDKVLEERASLLVQNVLDDEVLRARQSIVVGGVLSFMAVPLQTDDRVIGLLYVDSWHFERHFSRDELNLLTVMANVAAMRIEHARLAQVEEAEKFLQRELEQAAEIQRRHLPAAPPSVPGLDLAGHNTPCRTVGGDYYDYLLLPDGKVAVLVADVAGKGLSAALMMMNLQARVQIMAHDLGDVAGLIDRLNRSISVTCPGNRFITMFYCVIDPRTGQLTYCNAGHNPPLLIRSDGGIERLETGGPVLGLLLGIPYRQQQLNMAAGDLLALFSDGISEAEDPSGAEFGEERLGDVVTRRRQESAQAIIEAVNHAVEGWRASAPVADDATLVVARRIG
jgi:serine phosphatase RsbU (regulator of sigma subunit)/pSer/pThr/pTyr-binding forkhead associated (FHA) protein